MGASRKDVPGQGGGGWVSAQRGQSKATIIVTITSWGEKGGRGSKSPDFEGTSYMDGEGPKSPTTHCAVGNRCVEEVQLLVGML